MQEKAVFLPSLAALFFTAILSLAFPWFLKELIGNPTDALKAASTPPQVLAKSNHVVLELIGVLALQAFIAFFRVQGFIRSGESALNRLRRDLFGHLVRLPMPFFQEQRSGALSNRVSADLGIVRETLLNTVPQAVRQTVILIGGLMLHLHRLVETLAHHARQRAGGGAGHRVFRPESPRLIPRTRRTRWPRPAPSSRKPCRASPT